MVTSPFMSGAGDDPYTRSVLDQWSSRVSGSSFSDATKLAMFSRMWTRGLARARSGLEDPRNIETSSIFDYVAGYMPASGTNVPANVLEQARNRLSVNLI
jgi:hypothetical protein